jgi:hypothetical protein
MDSVLEQLKGPLFVMMKAKDFNIVTLEGPDGKPVTVPADTHISFNSTQHSKAADGVWQFRVTGQAQGQPVRENLFVRTEDILFIRESSKLVG